MLKPMGIVAVGACAGTVAQGDTEVGAMGVFASAVVGSVGLKGLVKGLVMGGG
jgi:hypothetical protein